MIRPGPTSSPASRSTRPNVTTCLTSASAGSPGLLEPGERLVAVAGAEADDDNGAGDRNESGDDDR